MQLSAGLQVPQSQRVIVGAGDATKSVGQEGHPLDVIRVAHEHPHLPAGLHVPEPDRAVVARGEEEAAVGGDGHAPESVTVSHEPADLSLGVLRTPNPPLADRDRRGPDRLAGPARHAVDVKNATDLEQAVIARALGALDHGSWSGAQAGSRCSA